MIDAHVYEFALKYISDSQHKIDSKRDSVEDAKLKSHLQTLQNVMKMVKHLFEGLKNDEAEKAHKLAIQKEVQKYEEVIQSVYGYLK